MNELTSKQFYSILKSEEINPDDLPALVVKKFVKSKKILATAESCTGGYISKCVTEVSGSSGMFECGVCSYANRIKTKVLGVDEQILSTVGAVSYETAKAMAEGVRALADSDVAVSTTGIAGPTGGTPEKPVGLVYIACASDEGTEVYKCLLGDVENADREKIRRAATDVALWLALSAIN